MWNASLASTIVSFGPHLDVRERSNHRRAFGAADGLVHPLTSRACAHKGCCPCPTAYGAEFRKATAPRQRQGELQLKQRPLSSSRQLQLTETKRDPKRGWCSVLAVRPRLRGELTNVVLAIDTGWQVKEGEQVAVLVHAVEQITMRNVIDSVLVSAHEEIPHCILAGRF